MTQKEINREMTQHNNLMARYQQVYDKFSKEKENIQKPSVSRKGRVKVYDLEYDDREKIERYSPFMFTRSYNPTISGLVKRLKDHIKRLPSHAKMTLLEYQIGVVYMELILKREGSK